MASNTPKRGDTVLASDGARLGKVKEVSSSCFKVNAPKRKDFWLANDSIANKEDGFLLLRYSSDNLDQARIEGPEHEGPHSHEQRRSRGGKLPLLLLTSAGVFALANRQRRQKLFSEAKKLSDKARSRTRQTTEDIRQEADIPLSE
jgi:hypothetical protein